MKSRKIRRAAVLLAAALAVCSSLRAQTTADAPVVEFLPAHRLFPRLTADGMAHQLGVAKDLHSRRWLGAIGAQHPLVQVSCGQLDLQAGVGATVHTGFLRTPPLLHVVTVDFVVEFPVDVRLSQAFVIRTGYGHHSAHLADDGIEQLGLRSVNYAKDYLIFLPGWALAQGKVFLYGGGRYDFHTLPETARHWAVRCGGTVGPVNVLPFLGLYAALDVRFKEEAAWRSTQSYQIGARISEGPAGAIRLAYTYRTGADDRGQFYRDTSTLSLLGLYVDL